MKLTEKDKDRKIEAYYEWKRTRQGKELLLLNEYQQTLEANIKNMGDLGSAELVAELLLRERKLRNDRIL